MRWDVDRLSSFGIGVAPLIMLLTMLIPPFTEPGCHSSGANEQAGDRADSPSSEARAEPVQLRQAMLSVDRNGEVSIDGHPVRIAALREALLAKQQALAGPAILIRVDRRSRFKDLRKILQICDDAGRFPQVEARFTGD